MMWNKSKIEAERNKLKKLKELKKIMDYWHREQRENLIRAQEAADCGNLYRVEKWMKAADEAKTRCDKDVWKPYNEIIKELK